MIATTDLPAENGHKQDAEPRRQGAPPGPAEELGGMGSNDWWRGMADGAPASPGSHVLDREHLRMMLEHFGVMTQRQVAALWGVDPALLHASWERDGPECYQLLGRPEGGVQQATLLYDVRNIRAWLSHESRALGRG